MEDSTQVLTLGQGPRDFALDEFKTMKADIVKIRVEWRDYAPDPSSRTKPDFDATDPAAYPEGVWSELDAAVSGIVARGMKPFLMVGPPAPEWATTGPRASTSESGRPIRLTTASSCARSRGGTPAATRACRGSPCGASGTSRTTRSSSSRCRSACAAR